MVDILIVGAGVIGGMLARELSRYRLSVCLLEKESDVACGASKANSGIVHGGYDPQPGTLKAKTNAAGVEKLFRVAKELGVPHRRCGSFVCAFGKEEEETLRALLARGEQNGIGGLSILTGAEARALEPALSPEVTAVLNVPGAGIICPYQLTIAAVGNAMDNGVTLRRNFEVQTISREADGFTLTSTGGEQVRGRYLVNCAGGFSDQIAEMAGDGFFRIIPRAGEYLLLDKAVGSLVGRTIFAVPGKNGKGVLVTPTADGNLLTGPTAEKVETPESRETTAAGLETVRRLAVRSVPGVDFRQVITSFCGVRASEAHGDFIIEPSRKVPGLLHIAAIDSPGLSSSAAIAEYAVSLLAGMGVKLERNPDFNPYRENMHAFREMSDEEKNAFIQTHPDFGRMVCRCESVSEGEIRAAIRKNPGAVDVDGIKRRTRAGMGRCQGGFCLPRVLKILSEETGVPMAAVTKKGGESYQLFGKIGEEETT